MTIKFSIFCWSLKLKNGEIVTKTEQRTLQILIEEGILLCVGMNKKKKKKKPT